ncbi:type I polyketide synthase [Nocardia sp. NPDC050712]|uniref:type I polyketide synthase n=1 Tax=Nocardia sp. NPDC050712 TaxID=3155518 RepID=UPI0033F60CA5
MSDIAVVGIGCRFAGGIESPESFWQFVVGKQDAAGDIPANRRHYHAADPREFDPGFFGISPRAAAELDPRQRLLLEVTWEALDDAGIAGRAARTPVGVYVGGCTVDRSVIDMMRPAGTVATACSSPLAALHLAGQALANGDYSVVLAGGVNTGYGRGGGMVALERLDDAVRHGDRVYAVVEATGSDQDGPDADAQALAREVCARAGRSPDTLSYTEAASGVAGVIKAALAVQHRIIPPRGRLGATPLAANVARMTIAVNGFGYAGTSAHAILAEYRPEPSAVTEPPRHYGVLPLSARSASAVRAMAGRFADLLTAGADPGRLAEAAWTRMAQHPFRAGVLLGGSGDMVRELRRFAAGAGPDATRTVAHRTAEPVFVFSGMGPQWWGMARELLGAEGAFAETARAIDAEFQAVAGWSPLAELLMRAEVDSGVSATEIAESANFLVQVALVAELAELGIRPAALVGHGVGEVSAAYVSGVLTLPEAVRVACHRARSQTTTDGMPAAELGEPTPRRPRIPLYSTVTGALVTEGEWDADYWCAHLRRPIRFADAVTALIGAGSRVFLEVGPHPVLSGTIRELLLAAGETGATVATLDRTRPDNESLRETLAGLYGAGVLDFDALFPPGRPPTAHQPLPRYPWQRTRLPAPLPLFEQRSHGGRALLGDPDRVGWTR